MKRYYKEINKKSFDFIFDDSPVEFIEATNYYDIDTFDYFLTLKMKNVSGQRIKSVGLKLHLFIDNTVVPYKKLEYTYDSRVAVDETFGEKDYIAIPQTFYKSFDIILTDVTFENGVTKSYNISSRKKGELIKEQTSDIVTACELVEENEVLKETFPAIVMPAFGERAWICSCSHKNSNDREVCERCSRQKAWLMSVYDKESLRRLSREEGNGTLTMSKRAEKARFIEKRDFKPVDEKKELVIENEIKKVEKRERYKDKMRIQAIPRIALYFLGGFLIYFLVLLLTGQI